ncbi:hypothetical protein RT41_GL000478 [Lactococcus fujiensis JCM 16395]|uniref:Uncharacterized protein n=1 Tax=Lactococcus fujiensis JCM 16395 TaxID=1291764 RepID=A0A2A5RJ37_9LACT|nr:hypothetical protein RT41_GL000478 [Lactococcus fujiensis JCM 16395]
MIRKSQAQKRIWDNAESIDVYESENQINSSNSNPEDIIVYDSLVKEVITKLTPSYRKLLKRHLRGEDVTRMEKYRLKERIKQILFDGD